MRGFVARMLPASLALFGLLAFWCPARAASSEAAAALYNEGNRAYAQGDYAAAVERYEDALTLGVADARVEYNLGLAYAKLEKIGWARLHFERAARLAPGDGDVRRNLSILLERIEGEPQPLPAGMFQGLVEFYEGLHPHRLAWWATGLWALLWLTWGAELLRGPRGGAQMLKSIRISALLLLAAVGAIFYARHGDLHRSEAVVVGTTVTARGGPDEGEAALGPLAPGRLVLLGRRRGNWVEIRVPGELEGWVPGPSVEAIGGFGDS